MGREVRKVPAHWQHPKDARGCHIPMYDTSYAEAVRQWEESDLPEWQEGARLWATGLVKTYSDGVVPIDQVVQRAKRDRPYSPPPENPTYEWWAGDVPRKPSPDDYMPDWSDNERTHLMMYEDTSEGTPISPAFAKAEALATWVSENDASALAGQTATCEYWLGMIRRGWSVSAVFENGRMTSGVAAQ